MKYIRTKDKIVEVQEDKQHLRFLQDFKQADTIEELCDEFVAVRKSDNTAHLGKIENTYWFYEQTGWVGRVENYKVIYGGIWTDKGLTYIAELNSQGELELL